MRNSAVQDDGTDKVVADAPLAPAGLALREPERRGRKARQAPTAWCAVQLAEAARAAAGYGLIHVASSERRADEIGRALRVMAPDVEVLVLPPWDCLPYDRASPSRECMGRRMAVLRRLGEAAEAPRVLVAAVEALMQRVPPAKVVRQTVLTLEAGTVLDREALGRFAASCGYVEDDRIDEPGEIAILGSVVDVFPAAAAGPVRLSLAEDGTIADIKAFDPLSQRTEAAVERVTLGPASELILAEGEARTAGAEHRLPSVYGRLHTTLELMPGAAVAQDPKATERARDFAAQVAEAHEAHEALAEERPPAPGALYLSPRGLRAALKARRAVTLDAGGVTSAETFAQERNPGRAFSDHVADRLAAGRRVVLTGLAHEQRVLARAVKRGLERTPEAAENWAAVLAAAEGVLLALEADLEAGFEDPALNLTVIAAPDVLGGRMAARNGSGGGGTELLRDPDLRVGDVVIHEDHGLGVLRGLETVEVGGTEREALRLEYRGGAGLLVPIEEFGRIWRYGAEEEAVTLDRLNSDAWQRKRAQLSRQLDETAAGLAAEARARAKVKGTVIKPPKGPYGRLAARFPYPLTPDQAAAIEAVLGDMASGRVMSRLICGDVGFGKTEVALRAAAAVALSGRQAAVVAPTTVLARQHFESFRRRFAGTGLTVGRLSRLVGEAEAAETKAGLADGSVRVVVATHALAAKDVAFADLGLLIIDEEQKFGAQLKADLRALAPRAHLLTMTATPIPRTLQLAMVGIEEVSVIATPPARRRPIRTFLAPFDAATVRTALMREKRRGGQSFVVAPRIEDIEPLATRLAELVPELSTRVAHGQLSPAEVDEVMVGFAAGDGDVLLATNIIESGLDVPGANTMLVWRADLFGLAQLHQLRGRVGRGRTQGVAYLLHEPESELPEATRARLSTLEAHDRLGSGLAISARDLELRGAGDLIGEEQAGHVKLIGTALYQRLLTRAVRLAKGEAAGPDWTPQLNIGLTGAIPEAYVPDATLRLNLYARLARLTAVDEVETFAEELEDRFGTPPEPVEALLTLARMGALALAAGVSRIDAGPRAVAVSFAGQAPGSPPNGVEVKDGRWIWRAEAGAATEPAEATAAALRRLAERA